MEATGEFGEDSLNKIVKATGVNFPKTVKRVFFYDTDGHDPGMFAELSLSGTAVEDCKKLNFGF